MTLRDQGFRFVKRGDEFKWVHPADLQPGDTDCSDMTDAEFDALVLGTKPPAPHKGSHQPIRRRCTLQPQPA